MEQRLIDLDFEQWIIKNRWWFIVPLKIYSQQHREVYKTKDELKQFYLINKQNEK